MAKQKDLVVLLQQVLPRFASDIDHRMRALRQGSRALLPQGGRGPNAPELTPTDAAHILIAAMSLERPKDENIVRETMMMADLPNAVQQTHIHKGVVEPWRQAPEEPTDSRKAANSEISSSPTFLEALTKVVTRWCEPPVLYVRFYPLTRGAEICFRCENWDEVEAFEPGVKVTFGRTDTLSKTVGVSFEMSAVLLYEVRGLLYESDDEDDKQPEEPASSRS